MMLRLLAPAVLSVLVLLAAPARADIEHAIADRILPDHAAFAAATAALADAAALTCDPVALRPAHHAAFDAWMAIAHLHLGPVEDDGRGLAISFWPDPKGLGAKAQKALLAGDPAVLADPAAFAAQSVAARGFSGLERLLWPPEAPSDPPATDTCPLIRATAADLARMAAELDTGWRGTTGFAATLLTAGEAGNTRFLSRQEVRQALFTQIITALEFDRDQRLGRPLATFDRPRPELAEARLSGRSMRNVILSLQAIRAMIESLTPDAPQTMAALDRALVLAQGLNEAGLRSVDTPAGWLKVQILQQAIGFARDKALDEVARDLDVDMGFNSADGD